MALLNNYTNLKATIATWLNRADLDTEIIDFITLLEARLNRKEGIVFERRSTLTANAETVALPSDFGEPISLFFDDLVRYGRIDLVTSEQLADEKLLRGDSSHPRKATILPQGASSTIVFAPIPDQDYPLDFYYRTKLDPLSDSVTSNWVLDDHPDIYLYGALVEAEPFLKNDERLQLWVGRLEKALEELRLQIVRRKWGGRLVQRPKRAIG